MTTDERGRWFRVYARSVRQHPKFRDLTGLELGAWTALRSEAELRDGAMFLDRSDAMIVLRRRKIPAPGRMLDRLIGLCLFDEGDDGTITVHDRQDHDRPRYPSDDPDEVRRRKAEQRERERLSRNGHEPVTSRDTNGHDTHARVQPQPQPTDSAPAPATEPGAEWDESVRDGADAYYGITGRFPSDRVLSWINRLTKLYGDELFAKVLEKCYLEDANPRDLLGRVEERCKAIYHRQHRDEIKAETRKAELTALAAITEQHEAAWTKCAECGVLGRKHSASGDHQFRPEKLRAVK